MRNEQAVSLSTVWVFLLPGPVCLVVSGPGLIHALGGHLMPVIVIGGSSDRNQETTGAFQEFPQVGVLHRHSWRDGDCQNRPGQCQVSFM
uniref:Uncharacterized protein n=2 Tax=Cyprinus carpio TaxID=7962 RepID=A0A8C1DDA4_CYPCA